MDRIFVLKLLGLAMGCGAKFVTGSLFVFNVYQDDVKSTFNYTQTQVELMSSMLNIGLGLGFLPGMFYDRFGPQWTSFVGLIVSVSGYLLIWSGTKLTKFYSTNFWLMAIYFFICGFGSVFTYMVALNTNIINFPPRHTGKIVGLLNAFFSGSPSIFSLVYYHVFGGDDFPSFMLMFAILFGAMNVMCILFLRQYTDDYVPYANLDNDYEPIKGTQLHSGNSVQSTSSQNGTNSGIGNTALNQASLRLIEILTNPDYEFLIWQIGFASCIGLIFANNITLISDAVGLKSYDDRITLVLPITNAIVSTCVGYLSDRFLDKLPRQWILMSGCFCFLLCEVLVLLFAYELSLLVISTIIAGFGVSIIWSMGPTIMKEMFFIGNLGRNWGIALLLASALGFGAQELFGALYDAEATGPGHQNCTKGMTCIRGGTIVTIVLASISIVIGFGVMLKRRCCTRDVSS